jgi:hypothetical protein
MPDGPMALGTARRHQGSYGSASAGAVITRRGGQPCDVPACEAIKSLISLDILALHKK